jgi:hypothetical protein
LYHGILALFLLGISIVALASGASNLTLSALPWKGDELVHYLLAGSIFGLLSIILAITGMFRFLFPIWTFIVFVLMVWGFLIRPYTFEGRSDFNTVLLLIAGALLAFLASLTLFGRRTARR